MNFGGKLGGGDIPECHKEQRKKKKGNSEKNLVLH